VPLELSKVMSPAKPGGKPSLKAFTRATAPRDKSLTWLANRVSAEVDARVDPLSVSVNVLRRMDRDPIVYLGEWAITALVRKPDLYHVKHPLGDKKIVAETEEWLWPLLPKLLPMIARSFLYGAIPYVFDWGREDLVVLVPGKNGKPRKRTLQGHYHFVRVHEVFPSKAEAMFDLSDRYLGLRHTETEETYDAGRSRVSIWDEQFGEITGQGARRRALAPTIKGEIFELLKARYTERTVHTPLVLFAPDEDIPAAEGEDDIPVGDFVAEQLKELRGGGVLHLPGKRDANGNRLFEVEPLELPERSEVFDRALNRFDAQKLASYLVPPAMTMIEEGIGGGAARVLKDMFATFVGALVAHAANELTAVVELVHGQNHPAKEPAPEIGANEIPDKVQKLYLEVLKTVGDPALIGRKVDVDGLLDHLGVPRKTGEDEDEQTEASRPPGRPLDLTSDREERREDARTDEGADDTGGRGTNREERGE